MDSTASKPPKLTNPEDAAAVLASLLKDGGRFLVLVAAGFLLVRIALVFFNMG